MIMDLKHFDKDIYIWDKWPVAHPSALFSGLAYGKAEYIETYLTLEAYPVHTEVVRNLPIRHPIIWLMD